MLPDSHHELWATVNGSVRRVRLHPRANNHLLALAQPHVFRRSRVTEDGTAVAWPGGVRLSMQTLLADHSIPWLTHLAVVPPQDRYRPLLPVLRYAVPPAPLPAQPTRQHLIRMFGLREGELGGILAASPVPERVMLHRLHDLGVFLKEYLYGEMPVAVLRRPWLYAAHCHPHQHHLHTLQACLTLGRLDLIEDPLWALARAELVP